MPLYFITVSRKERWKGWNAYSSGKRDPKELDPSLQRQQGNARCFPRNVPKTRDRILEKPRLAGGHWWRNRRLGRMTRQPLREATRHWTMTHDQATQSDSGMKIAEPKSLLTQVKTMMAVAWEENVAPSTSPFLSTFVRNLHVFTCLSSPVVTNRIHSLSKTGLNEIEVISFSP